jgi:hypothetical protein
MWMFYEQSQWAANYGIESKNLLFYLIWAILLIPFQLAIDILFYNLIEQYHGMDILHYISLLKTRFDNRKTLWKGFEKDKGLKVEDTFIHLDCNISSFTLRMVLFLPVLFHRDAVPFGSHVHNLRHANHLRKQLRSVFRLGSHLHPSFLDGSLLPHLEILTFRRNETRHLESAEFNQGSAHLPKRGR